MADRFTQEPLPGFGEPAKNSTSKVDTDAIAASARGPAEPRVSEAWADLGGGVRTVQELGHVAVPEGSPLTRHRTPNTAARPRLEDPELDAEWQAQRAGAIGSVPTASLTGPEQTANETAFVRAHRSRTTAQVRDEGR